MENYFLPLDGGTIYGNTLLNSTSQLQFGDSGTYIHQSADGVLDLVADTELELNGGIVDINSSLGDINIGAVSGNVIISGDTGAMTLTNTGTGNITIDAAGNNSDIIFKGTDGGVDITALTLDMSDGGKALFDSGASFRGTIAYRATINKYGSSNSPFTFNVTVATQTTAHPYNGDGSSSKYVIDGVMGAALTLHGADDDTSNSEYYYY